MKLLKLLILISLVISLSGCADDTINTVFCERCHNCKPCNTIVVTMANEWCTTGRIKFRMRLCDECTKELDGSLGQYIQDFVTGFTYGRKK